MKVLDKAAELWRRFMGRGKPRELDVPPKPTATTTYGVPEAREEKGKRSPKDAAEGRRQTKGAFGRQRFPPGYWETRPLTPDEMRAKYPSEARAHREKMAALRAQKKAQRLAKTQAVAPVTVQTPEPTPAVGVK